MPGRAHDPAFDPDWSQHLAPSTWASVLAVAAAVFFFIVDMLLPLEASEIPEASERLVAVGFRRQVGPDPFPPTRPMLEGSLREEGEVFAIHLHVIPSGDPEIEEMRSFRDRLRADPALRDAYVAQKRRIVEEGVPDALEYSYRKGVFVVETLRELGFPVERNTLGPGTE